MAADEDLFEIELDRLEREIELGDEDGATRETYVVVFDCHRHDRWIRVRITLEATTVTTLSVVPQAMAELHRSLAALVKQSEGWARESS